MGIGAWIDVTDNDLTQTRVIQCGENYLGQESLYEHFGLDDFNDPTPYVDQIRIKWPSGIIDYWQEVEEHDRMVFIEGSSPCKNFDNTAVDLCDSGAADFELAVPWDGGSVEWTN